MDVIEMLKLNVLQGRRNRYDDGLEDGYYGQPGVEELVYTALEQGISVQDILVRGLGSGMEEVGRKYDRKEYFIPDMLAAAEAVGMAVEVLEPHFQREQFRGKGKFVLATVEKDQHDIGKNIVGIMIKGAGFQVRDLGIDVPAERIVETVIQEEAPFLGLSALLDTTMKYMAETVELLEKKNVRHKVKVLVGGAPVTREFAEKIGADAYCKDAFAAVEQLDKFIQAGWANGC
ncbi:corrinoid protein [Dethiobacter alkaliphilus]|uniref:corrinoid protein n=1 Tax=Dethiobacter alkaliphilus TaxID=427926 RepID=UPI00222682E2|nr:corrinoid protein [Dethiobacter alkaliphilus]MCW3490971.1 corrinoid protein [Dethiobacter alkaliphilus]